jgi:ABC-type nitrate/sulfonate/bicarbonate transport system substrate-binding protein
MEAADFCATNLDEAARITAKAFRIPEPDMKLYMSRMKYRMEMPKAVVQGNFQEAAELAMAEGIIKKMPNWNDFLRPQIMKEAAPDRAAGW